MRSALKQSANLGRVGINQFLTRSTLKHAVLVVRSLKGEIDLGRRSKSAPETREFALFWRVEHPTRRKQAIQRIHIPPSSRFTQIGRATSSPQNKALIRDGMRMGKIWFVLVETEIKAARARTSSWPNYKNRRAAQGSERCSSKHIEQGPLPPNIGQRAAPGPCR